MDTLNIIFIPFLIIVIFILIWFIRTSNRLNRYRVIIDESKRNVDIALAKRYDTISEMIKVSKSYARYEKDTFKDLVKLRSNSSLKDSNRVIEVQDKAIEKIYALAENYPELKSSSQFLNLQNEISSENEELAASKRIVNNNISKINQNIVSFPTSIVASLKGLEKIEFLHEEDLASKSLDNLDYTI